MKFILKLAIVLAALYLLLLFMREAESVWMNIFNVIL